MNEENITPESQGQEQQNAPEVVEETSKTVAETEVEAPATEETSPAAEAAKPEESEAQEAVEEEHNPFLVPKDIVEPENPLPDAEFDSIAENIRKALESNGWNQLMPVQFKTMPYMREGRDMLIQSKTGSGKTGAFLIPLTEILQEDHPHPQALILVPTRELANQVYKEFEIITANSNLRAVALFGGVSYKPQLDALREGVHLVIATPGRLLDHLEQRNLDFLSLRDLVLDEADEMLSMGFYPDMKRIKRFLPKQHCTTMFSATIPQNVKSLAREFQTPNCGFLSLSYEKVGADNLQHHYYVVDQMDKDKAVAQILEQENPESCIIFCNMKKDVSYLCEYLNAYGFSTEELSGDINQKQREKTLKNFKDQRTRILIATDVAARGIDVSHVSHVIIHDQPDDNEVYVHRAGRTARAGRSGVAISVVSPVEEKEIRKTASDFSIKFTKMPEMNEELLNSRIRQRVTNLLEQDKRKLTQKVKNRISRYMPLVDQLAEVDEEKELLAYLLDKYYWEKTK